MTDSPDKLVPVQVTARDLKTGRLVQVGVTVRRSSEARLWAWLAADPDYERAVSRIMWAYQSFNLLPGLQPIKAPSWQRGRVDGRPDAESDMVALMDARKDYYAWAARCEARGISYSAVMDVLGQGKSIRQVGRERRMSFRWARRQLWEGLGLYCELLGWKNALAPRITTR